MATFQDLTESNLSVFPHNKEAQIKSQISRSLSRDSIMLNNGLVTATKKDEDCDKHGYIVGLNNGIYGAFMAAYTYIDGSVYPCTIANTLNDGLVYTDVDEDGETVSLGSVDNVCIVGTAKKATAILIPIDSYQAVLDGQKILEGLRKDHEAMFEEEALDDPYDEDEPEVKKKDTKTLTPIFWK